MFSVPEDNKFRGWDTQVTLTKKVRLKTLKPLESFCNRLESIRGVESDAKNLFSLVLRVISRN